MDSESSSPRFLRRAWKVMVAAAVLATLSFAIGAGVQATWPWLTYTDPQGIERFFQILLQESAIACLIALVVKEMIESEYERRQQVAMVAGAAASRRSVLRVLFGEFFDDETIEQAYGAVFTSPLVRENMTVAYSLSPHPSSPWLVRLDVRTSYSIRNSASIVAHFDPHTVVANYAALFPDDQGLAPPTLKSVTIGGKPLSASEIESLNSSVNRSENPVTFNFEGQKLKAKQSIDVEFVYQREKLVCDAEVLTMSYPTKKVSMLVQNVCDGAMEFDVRLIGQHGFVEPPGERAADTVIARVNEGILLKDNGWVLFWNDRRLRPSEIPGLLPNTGAAE